jgi:hypothetical protein
VGSTCRREKKKKKEEKREGGVRVEACWAGLAPMLAYWLPFLFFHFGDIFLC